MWERPGPLERLTSCKILDDCNDFQVSDLVDQIHMNAFEAVLDFYGVVFKAINLLLAYHHSPLLLVKNAMHELQIYENVVQADENLKICFEFLKRGSKLTYSEWPREPAGKENFDNF